MNALETALDLLARGYWPVPITPPDDSSTFNPGKAPIGQGWGLKKHTEASLWKVYARHPGAGVGIKLGPDGGLVDLDVDEPEKAAPVLRRIFGKKAPDTLGWSSTRGRHLVFLWDARLERYGKAIVKNHPAYPGLELRLGWSTEGKQYQSVCPPSVGTDGKPREWNGTPDPAPLPDAFFADLDEHLLAAKPRKHGKRPVLDARPVLMWDAETRAVEYLKRCDPAVSGQHGHDKAFKAACKVGPGFNLAPEVTLRLLAEVWNPTCQPPWSDKELRHKVEDAYKTEKRRGWLLGETRPSTNGWHEPGETATAEPVSETFDDPFRLAREFLRQRCLSDGFPTLRYWQEEWNQWNGTRYRVVAESELRTALAITIKEQFDAFARRTDKPAAKVTRTAVGNTQAALAALTILGCDDCPSVPAWLEYEGEDEPAPADVIPARNGLIHLPALVEGREGLLPCTPRFFSPNCLGYDFDPQAPRPDHWLAFLGSLWPEDPESIQALQEWFGYLLTPDTSQQKMLLVIGPPRSGKGTIARVLSALVGEANVVSPTLSSLTNEFRVAPLIGKTVAVFSDARLNGRSDVPVIVERLLSISGEDAQTIDRKNKESWSGKLRVRFVLMANELPQLTDASKAITSRTVILRLTRSFLGHEDRTLLGKLESELPSILLWSVAGWARLKRRGYFVQPASGETLLEELEELTSPVSTFLADCCEVGPAYEVEPTKLYARWKQWCQANGREHPGTVATLGRYLRAALPHLETTQRRVEGSFARFFQGLRLSPTAEAEDSRPF